MQVERTPVDIVLPPNLSEASAGALKLCEMFVANLLANSSKEVVLSVDAETKSVSCTDRGIRETVRLFLGAGRLDEFKGQMTSLLHAPRAQNAIGELHCVHRGLRRRFVFLEGNDFYLDWKIICE